MVRSDHFLSFWGGLFRNLKDMHAGVIGSEVTCSFMQMLCLDEHGAFPNNRLTACCNEELRMSVHDYRNHMYCFVSLLVFL